jgi:uncharacterized protein (DUF2461 family)
MQAVSGLRYLKWLKKGENMFAGFDKSTVAFLKNITMNNNKQYFNEHRGDYENFIKRPLVELYYDLLDTVISIDNQIEMKLQKSISTPYTDSRFMQKKPIKEYMYLRYKLRRSRKTDIPGFFFDASIETIRFGLKIYNITSSGMEKIRLGLLGDKAYYTRHIKELEKKELRIYDCEKFKKDHYTEIDEPLKGWLNSKDIRVYYMLGNYRVENNMFFRPELRNKIADTFSQLKKLYHLVKSSLDEGGDMAAAPLPEQGPAGGRAAPGGFF